MLLGSVIVGVGVGTIVAWLLITAVTWGILSIPAVNRWYTRYILKQTTRCLKYLDEEIDE